ncbi:GlsB/YeaQ/YmgE family stress response membrane protein [Hydrogenophaga pseudoflava]|uniref:GlsB/YeaQ/YmgE family stress response membrane protein n=1 Tax=Hydrogenophaga pseudoflava TaxID=47421 RepID=UPI0027E3CC36|nr:GlsB/YeaQ/YmgE family stress response membrane protein [Hydrogenophaga pseudoflava]MDQ7744485.1 GlsB/YeaQ/YmgE family stress response membrane protein [Hydrogenophaga pseudoflava]
MMSILGTLFIGLIAGLVARMLKPGDDSMGWIMTALLGVAGSFLASYAGAALGLYTPGQPAGFIASVVGAIVLLVVYGMLKKNTS